MLHAVFWLFRRINPFNHFPSCKAACNMIFHCSEQLLQCCPFVGSTAGKTRQIGCLCFDTLSGSTHVNIETEHRTLSCCLGQRLR